MTAILDFWISISSHSDENNFIEKFDSENGGVAVGIWFLSHLEVEIWLGVILPPLTLGVSFFVTPYEG